MANFRWRIPFHYNIGVDVCDRQAPDATALIHVEAGETRTLTFGAMAAAANRLANTFVGHGLAAGDRVGVLLGQAPETLVAHVAAYKAGMIAVPLFTLFGPDALAYRLADSGTRAVVTDAAGAEKLALVRGKLPDLDLVLSIDGAGDRVLDYAAETARASDAFTAVDTRADDPALLIYTSGTTGPPKGALHAHAVLLGHLPGVELPHGFFPQAGDLFWTPADWAWIGGLLDVLLPSLHHGVPVLAHRAAKFDPEEAFALLAAHDVRNAFLPPTALKLMRQVPAPQERWSYQLRSIGSGGETLGPELLGWGREAFGLTINEFYGQTECNLIVANCAALMAARPGSMGRPVPGHTVAVLDANGDPVKSGETGEIAVRRPDPAMFLGYWNDDEATRRRFNDDWLLTGDIARIDRDGYLWFVGRDDDVITSAGYRIGPGEVESCLATHPAVAMAAVVGVPDPVRTQRVKAFLVLKDGTAASDGLARAIRDHVRGRLAAHAYPRDIAFVDALPQTATGKIRRAELRDGG